VSQLELLNSDSDRESRHVMHSLPAPGSDRTSLPVPREDAAIARKCGETGTPDPPVEPPLRGRTSGSSDGLSASLGLSYSGAEA
jgi:hypothetical protein